MSSVIIVIWQINTLWQIYVIWKRWQMTYITRQCRAGVNLIILHRRQGCYNVTATKLGWLQLDFFLMKKMKNTEARYCHSPIQPNTYCCSYFGYLLLKTTTMILVQVKSLTSPYCFGSYCTPQSWPPLEAHTALVCSILPKVDLLKFIGEVKKPFVIKKLKTITSTYLSFCIHCNSYFVSISLKSTTMIIVQVK